MTDGVGTTASFPWIIFTVEVRAANTLDFVSFLKSFLYISKPPRCYYNERENVNWELFKITKAAVYGGPPFLQTAGSVLTRSVLKS